MGAGLKETLLILKKGDSKFKRDSLLLPRWEQKLHDSRQTWRHFNTERYWAEIKRHAAGVGGASVGLASPGATMLSDSLWSWTLTPNIQIT